MKIKKCITPKYSFNQYAGNGYFYTGWGSSDKIFYDKDNIIYHKGGGVSQQIKSTRLFYALHAKYFFVKKHFSALAFISSAFVLIFLSPLSRLAFSVVIKRSKKELFQTIGGYYKFYQYLLTSKI